MRNVPNRLCPVAIVALVLASSPTGAVFAQAPGATDGGKRTSEFTAQKKRKAAPKRAPARVVVRPAYRYHLDHSPYPRSDDVSWPGPGAVRQCTSWLAPEHRPSGTVIVPHTRCWWQRP